MTRDLFTPTVAQDRLHERFVRVQTSDTHATTRELMNRVFALLPKPDGNFIKDFQTDGFDARVWELYLFALQLDGVWTVTHPKEDRPDFLFSRDGVDVWVEAAIAGPEQKLRRPDDPEALQEFIDHGLVARYGTPLGRKLDKRYWELPWVAGKPLVIAVADFVESDLFRFNHHGLSRYLYGAEPVMTSQPGEPVASRLVPVERYAVGTKVLTSFFSQPGAEHISAVLFSNSGTVPKFQRKAFDAARDRHFRLVRYGYCEDEDPRSPRPDPFAYVVGDAVEETWAEGIVVMHNPRALVPVPRSFFAGTLQFWRDGDQFETESPQFHPHNSVTEILRAPFEVPKEAFDRVADRRADERLIELHQGQISLAQLYARHAELLGRV